MRLYDTFTRQLQELPPPPGPVRMYFCGPTVYARAHIGNARPFILGIWLRRWLRSRGYEATLVHNITDVNDRIYEAAPGASAPLAEQATQWYLDDTRDLGIGEPDFWPKATEHIPQIIDFAQQLIERGHAYAVEGDVYFRVASFPEYGRLSGQRPDQVEEQEPNPLKEDPRDFALWKANKPGEDTWWESPWGRGRPGWHIECSVMAEELLGPVFEVHGGGIDLVFPHHENELAQSRALGHEFARIWTHNGMLEFTSEKMSKSLGNDVSLRNVLDTWGREVVLLFYMAGHWRKPIDFSDETLEQARAQAETFRDAFRSSSPGTDGSTASSPEPREALDAALDNDFDTPRALAVLHSWRRAGRLDWLREGLAVFGLESLAEAEKPPEDVAALAGERERARAERRFDEADRLRREIEAAGWEVRDVADGFQLVPRR
jgi:cysteinyl-tRNA synthetase